MRSIRFICGLGVLGISGLLICGSVARAELNQAYYDQVVGEALESNTDYQAQQQAIAEKSDIVAGIEDRIAALQDQISALQSQAVTLEQHIALLDTSIEDKAEQITKTGVEIESLQLEIESLQRQIRSTQDAVKRKKNNLKNTIEEMYVREQLTPLEITVASGSLSDYYNSLEYAVQVQDGIDSIVQGLKQDQQALEQQQQAHTDKKAAAAKQQTHLEQQQVILQDEKAYKEAVLTDTEASEAKFQAAYEQARQDRQAVQADIDTSISTASAIKIQVRETALKKLDRDPKAQLTTEEAVALSDNASFIWPAIGVLTCEFHCLDYPFQAWIGPHSGTDIGMPVGTSVRAAADGCVSQVAYPVNSSLAYVVMVNGGTFSTAYLHLSRIDVQPNQCFKQGTIIGASGGGIGVAGAGLSTGPHLHFEIRVGGIPVNAQDYLPAQ